MYELKKLRGTRKKLCADYLHEGGQFCVDEDGYMYFYTSSNSICKIGIDKTIQEFQYSENKMNLTKPIILNGRVYHKRTEKDCEYILITDTSMNEITRVYLKDNESVMTMLNAHNHIFFTTVTSIPSTREGYIADGYIKRFHKMTEDGKICWEYEPPDNGWLVCDGIIPLSNGKILTSVSYEYGVTVDCHIINENGILDSIISKINLWNIDITKNLYLSMDRVGNVCVAVQHMPIYNNEQLLEPYSVNFVIIDKNGVEICRKKTNLPLNDPFILYDCNHVICIKSVFTPGSVEVGGIFKVNILQEIGESWIEDKSSFTFARGDCFGDKIVICYGDFDKAKIYCFNYDGKILWDIDVDHKKGIPYFELKDNYLYYFLQESLIYKILV